VTLIGNPTRVGSVELKIADIVNGYWCARCYWPYRVFVKMDPSLTKDENSAYP